ncbi:MAG TPA: isoprenylcysteine carboxylmethyltransferase family protein [Steroidobacteraceae bacterium]|nr:isoprenylcysteine carboxylmethyltransferase family protein [Steroidobacteraceae bacterium]
MADFYRTFFPLVWLAWVITWYVFARNVKTTVRRQPTLPRLLDVTLLVAAAALLWDIRFPVPALMARFLPDSLWQFWAGLGALLTLAGLSFSVWARVHLGRNWSGVITIKADHELITTGPYALVRHPIYSGLVLGFIGTALAVGQWRGVLSVALALVCFVQRMRTEESWMRQQFGAAYVAYAQRVRAFIPGVV